jgi:ubiquinone/menaquinone biosynthesis C-methylase UbiE
MATDYNQIAEEYKESKQMPWRLFAELPTLLGLAGDLAGKTVLDLACGDGFYTRRFRQLGAAEVVGVDISAAMIELAKSQNPPGLSGIDYLVKDVHQLGLNKKFDLIAASYLLNYASDQEQLKSFCRVISRHLKPGGRFITINNNPDCKCPPGDLRHYGFTRESMGSAEGSEIIYRFFSADGSHIDVVNYQLERSTHESTLQGEGLTEVQWQQLAVSDDGIRIHGKDYWEALIRCQPVIGLSCRKA